MITYLTAYGSGLLGLFLRQAGGTIYYHDPFMRENELLETCEKTNLKKAPLKLDSNLIGMFHAGNKNGIVQAVNSKSEETTYLDTKFTCLGNLILVNDKGALVAPALKKHKSELTKILGVPCKFGTIAGLQTVGSLGLTNNHGAVGHPDMTDKEMEVIKIALKVENVGPATIGKSGFVGASALVSDDSLILSPAAITPEMAQIANILKIE